MIRVLEMTSGQTTEESEQEQGNPSDASMRKRKDWLSEKKDELEDVIQQLEEVIRIKEFAIDRLTKELSDVRDQSALLEGQREKSLDQKEDRIEELEEALRESVRITADREVALDAETQQRTMLDQKVFFPSFPLSRMLSFIAELKKLLFGKLFLISFIVLRWDGWSSDYNRCITPRV